LFFFSIVHGNAATAPQVPLAICSCLLTLTARTPALLPVARAGGEGIGKDFHAGPPESVGLLPS